MKQRIACYFVIYHRSDRFFLFLFFDANWTRSKSENTRIIEKTINKSSRRLIKQLPFSPENIISRIKFRNYHSSISISSSVSMERRNIYIRVPNLIIGGITFQWIPRPDQRSKPANTRDASKHEQIQSFWHVSSPRDNEERVHVTPNNKVARFSSGWIAVNIVDGY